MRGITATIVALAAMCSLAFASDPETDFGATVRRFSAARYKLAQDLSSRLSLPLPDQADAFFRAAVTGQWESVSDLFEQVKEQGNYGRPIPQLRNELWAPIQETMGIWEVWVGWKEDSTLLAMFHEPVLASMPKGSIYFGGSDYGRFVITAANETRPVPAIYCVTQNALSDPIYAAYLRATYTNIWVPEQADIDRAIAQYVHEVETGTRSTNDDTVITAGRVSKWGVMGVMALHGIISQMIFEHNKASHSFFVEESYVLDWMYPYLEPCGLIMKLNTTPMQSLPKEAISRDQAFWRDYVDRLEKHEGFAGNQEARLAFSKLRSGIAGLYAYRKLYTQSEAAFQQAIRLCPSSPEAHFRFAELCEERGQPDRAIKTMEEFLPLAPTGSARQVEDYIEHLKEKVQNPPSDQSRYDKAISELNATQSERDRFYALNRAAKESMNVAKTEEARRYAEELQKLLTKYSDDWNYGNAIQDVHVVLGRIALQEGKINEAKTHLLEAGKSPGSPQMNSFGPNMTLAKELLEKGEKDIVLQYFDLCAKFWKMDFGQLSKWKAQVEKGEIPNFGANLAY